MAAFVHGDHAVVNEADEFGAAVETQHQVVAVGVEKNALLDQPCRHAHQRHGVGLAGSRAFALHGRGIEHRQQVALGVADRGCRAAQGRVAIGEMVGTVNGHRPMFDDAGPDTVGALPEFAPVGAVPEAGCTKAGAQGLLHPVIENHAVGVGEQQRVARTRDLGGEILHLGARDGHHLAQFVAVLAELAARDDIEFDTGRIEPIITDAPIPRARHEVRRIRPGAGERRRRSLRRWVDHLLSSVKSGRAGLLNYSCVCVFKRS